MTYTATLTSKGQITIPAKILKEKNFKKGQKLIFNIEDNKVVIETPVDFINRLAGSVSIPDKLKNVPIDKAIELAKQIHFSSQK